MINDLPVTVDRYSWGPQLGVVPWEFPIPKLALARRFSAGSVAIYLLVVPMTRVLILMRHSETLSQVMKSLRHMASHTSEESNRLSSARKNSKMMLL